MKRAFFKDTSGGTAMMFALAAVPLVLSVGAAIDYTRYSRALSHMQAVNDAGALAAAASRTKNESELFEIADKYIQANVDLKTIARVKTDKTFLVEDDGVQVEVSAEVEPVFMQLAGISKITLVSKSVAVRGYPGKLEVAMVLDNTWSMSADAGGGKTRIQALKDAARTLVEEITSDPDADVRIGLVPYADYVNVGVHNRSKSWVDVPNDYTETVPKTCEMRDWKEECTYTQVGPRRTCTGYQDGIPYTYDCTQYNTTCTRTNVTPYEVCEGGYTREYKWYGCVGSRKQGQLRLNDTRPEFAYPGGLSTYQNCLNPIIDLTNTSSTVLTAIDAMVINVGWYRPNTYIPGGLIWGVNLLSPTEPFSSGLAYDDENRNPRKVIVLMTDGVNTMRFDPGSGAHHDASPSDRPATDADTAAICDYAKQNNIEVYTVAMAVDDSAAETLLRNCASGSDHFFDASDAAALNDAFAEIAMSLREIRLAK